MKYQNYIGLAFFETNFEKPIKRVMNFKKQFKICCFFFFESFVILSLDFFGLSFMKTFDIHSRISYYGDHFRDKYYRVDKRKYSRGYKHVHVLFASMYLIVVHVIVRTVHLTPIVDHEASGNHVHKRAHGREH